MHPAALLARIEALAAAQYLFVSGVVAIEPGELVWPETSAPLGPAVPDAGTAGPVSIALLSPAEPGFWDHVTAQPEFADGGADPLDRWSGRVIGGMADQLGAAAVFPFGGPPWHPFLAWARRSGQAFASPVQLHVHLRMGLWASWRGALLLDRALPATQGESPCPACRLQPCKSACPANAITPGQYDLAACHGWLATPAGEDCRSCGCAVRRACPLSSRYGRLDRESAHHMRHFHP